MRIAITGATGYLGSAIADGLAARGHAIIALTRGSRSLPVAEETVRLDGYSDSAALRVATARCDALIHFADMADRRRYRRDMLDEAGRTVVAIRQAIGDRPVRFIVASSVYAAYFDEGAFSLYGESKRKAEIAATCPGPGPRAAVLRLPLVYGPRTRGTIGLLSRWIARGVPLPFAMTKRSRHVLSLVNLTDLLADLVERDPAEWRALEGSIYEPADATSVTLAGLAVNVGRAIGREARLVPVPFIDRLVSGGRPTGLKRPVPGWSPPYSTLESLSQSLTLAS